MTDHTHTSRGRRCPNRTHTLLPEGHAWLGWQGTVAHPGAPTGSGGPGGFVPNQPLADDNAPHLPHPQAPGPQRFSPDQVQLSAQKKPNAPPATTTQSWSMLKMKNDHMEVDVSAEVIADSTTTEDLDAETKAPFVGHSGLPGYSQEDGKITQFDAKFTWKGKITIQTVYNKGKATDLSCYGRGTTPEDIENGDITLGFHESCHRADYVNYLKNNALPKPPELKIGMSASSYDTAAKAFNTAYDNYVKALRELWKKTDEVGHKLSTVESTGKCYEHKIDEGS